MGRHGGGRARTRRHAARGPAVRAVLRRAHGGRPRPRERGAGGARPPRGPRRADGARAVAAGDARSAERAQRPRLRSRLHVGDGPRPHEGHRALRARGGDLLGSGSQGVGGALAADAARPPRAGATGELGSRARSCSGAGGAAGGRDHPVVPGRLRARRGLELRKLPAGEIASSRRATASPGRDERWGVGPRPMPLLLSHGWPGSIVEFRRLVPMLTDPARFGGDPADAFTVVAPSLPGYTFSFQPNQTRFSVPQMADLFATLMTDVLGYARFAAQGGDWGAFVTSYLGAAHADKVVGVHVNLLAVPPDRGAPAATLAPDERAYLQQLDHWLREETGYQAIQGTKPQTLAYGLTDSPVGLAEAVRAFFRAFR